MRLMVALILLTAAQGLTGCGGSKSPSAPSAPSPVPQGFSQPVSIAGDYTLTLIANSVCDIPNEVATRTYAATISPHENPNRAANTWFDVALSGAPFLDEYKSFAIGVAGRDVVFSFDNGEGPELVEQVAPNAYLAVSGFATASVQTSRVSTISAPFEGLIEHCVLNTPMGPLYNCAPGQTIAHAGCPSKNHRLILTRR
jgi:hypothetical protein